MGVHWPVPFSSPFSLLSSLKEGTMAVEQARGQALNAAWTARARQVMPGGSIGTQLPEGQAFVAVRGQGSRIYDVDGNAFLDYVLGSGPLILGHAHPAITEAVIRQAEQGAH